MKYVLAIGITVPDMEYNYPVMNTVYTDMGEAVKAVANLCKFYHGKGLEVKQAPAGDRQGYLFRKDGYTVAYCYYSVVKG